MKRTLALILCLLLLTGCGKPTAAETTQPETTVPETTQPETTLPPETEAETEAPSTETVDAVVVAQADPVITGQQNTVHVATVDEFLNAIAPDTEIVVDAALLDLSQAANYGKSGGKYYRWEDPFDGPELILQDLSNFTIRGSGQGRTDGAISAVPRYADVLTFENCANIYVANLTVGHTQEPGYCMGGVLHYINSQSILVENCDLYGCGTMGVNGDNSLDIQVYNCYIHDCSVSGVEFTECKNVRVDSTTFERLGTEEFNYDAPIFRIYGGSNITRDGAEAVPFQ